MQEKYPDTVHLSEGPCSQSMEACGTRIIRSGIQNTECLNSFRFGLVIVWRIRIDEEGKVSPKLDLLTKVPQRALELDKNRVIETAPLSFRTLLGVLGIEAALECLIKMLCTENN
uniref:Centromere protein P n=1 Tax=Castor canadensis TaxID=51338 RepID=A0A8C0WBB4_CASCN